MKVLTKEEIEIAFQSNEIIEGYKQYQCIELIQNRTETLGFLVMAIRISDGKLVGMSHRELNKPLLFELRKDCNRFIKLIKNQIKASKDEQN